ncbi:hypothetical protein Taro_001851 [Colocasia esculenta]|uniref:Uncharacterized protein n=1 Tax=Colocasia esculenta TaxID=4460 RepID=A0A843THE6_COLES|nr:hypothetical protein [Colocasia esculenta]
MEQYLEEKKASQKRPVASFQRQDEKKTMKDYDAILGLDWLEEHYALVDCRRKRIVFRIPGVVGDVSPLEETVEKDSERGD